MKILKNSDYNNDYDIIFTVKTKKGDRVGSKREVEEEDDYALKSISNLRKKMKRMEANFFNPKVYSDEGTNLVNFPEDSNSTEQFTNLTVVEINKRIDDEFNFNQPKKILEVLNIESTKNFENPKILEKNLNFEKNSQTPKTQIEKVVNIESTKKFENILNSEKNSQTSKTQIETCE